MAGRPPREVLVEVMRRGAYAKVSAIDPVTNTEATVVGPAASSDARLIAVARQKLGYILARKLRG